jgi:ferredoxin/flavodoxin
VSIEIYYFSGTGNSLSVARDMAIKTKMVLISIPAAIMANPKIKTDADSIGIIFPAYIAPVSGIPLIVEKFVKKLDNIKSKYIFAVCTSGGYEIFNAWPPLRNLNRLIKSMGGKLSAAYTVRLPMNNLEYTHIPIPISQDFNRLYKKSNEKIEFFSQSIIKKKSTTKIIIHLFMILISPLYFFLRRASMTALKKLAKEPADTKLKYNELIPLTDKSISVDEQCNGCGICSKVCSVRNIKIIEQRPTFLHHCEMCYACDEWCPQNAIHHWGRKMGIKYHHPSVKMSDLVKEQG